MLLLLREMTTLVIIFASVYACTCVVSSSILNHGYKKFSQRLRRQINLILLLTSGTSPLVSNLQWPSSQKLQSC
jgi:hypothetical protein